jgi:hypothetical protein
MSEHEQDAESAEARTVAIVPDTGELPTVPNVSADLVATMNVEIPTGPLATQVLPDEEVPGTLLLTMPAALSQDAASHEYRRIGPGVPTPERGPNASRIDPATAAVWHGLPQSQPRRTPRRGWLLPLAVLIAVIALLLWRHSGGPLSVSGVAASAGQPSIGCDSVETVTATVRTNGGAGTIVYRWSRSDGTVSDDLQQPVSAGTKQTDVVLRWAFSGYGSMHAQATIEVVSPGTASAVASFVYSCP